MKNRPVFINNLFPALQFEEKQVTHFIHTLESFGFYAIPPGELSIVFMDDPALANLHDKFFDDPSTTDVITFEGDPYFDFAGEICISIDHAISAAQEYHTSLEQEIILYIIHGYLHLAGLDDIDPKDREKMRHAEFECIEAIKKAGVSPHFSLS